MMWYSGGQFPWWGWTLGVASMVVFWGVVAWAVWYLVTGVARRPQDRPPSDTDPERILDERLARGEIDADDYRRLRDLLREDDQHRPGGRPPVGSGRSH